MKNFLLKKLYVTLFGVIFCFSLTHAQTYQRATTETHSGNVGLFGGTKTVENPGNAIDAGTDDRGNLTTSATIKASPGIAGGIAAYTGYSELSFPSTLAANTTSYIGIKTQDELLPSLLGGALGNLLAGVAGAVLIGNQQFTVQVKNGSNVVLSGSSSQVSNGDFSSQGLRIVVDADGHYFIAVSPNSAYNRIRITNKTGSLIGLGVTKTLDLYGAYTTTTAADCDQANYTGFSGGGGLLGANVLTPDNGVQDPENAIDNDPNTYSELILPNLSVTASAQQTFFFSGQQNANSSYQIGVGTTSDLLNAGVLQNIKIIGYKGSDEVVSKSLDQLVDLDLLTLLQNNQRTNISFKPGVSIDRITVKLSNLVNIGLQSTLRLYGVTKGISQPTTEDATDVLPESATLHASFDATDCLNGSYGFEYSTDPNFAEGTGTQVTANNLSNKMYSTSITNFDPETQYYFRAFATATYNGITQNSYGTIKSFTTPIISWDGSVWNNNDGPDTQQNALIDGDFTSSNDGSISVNNLSITSGNTLTLDDPAQPLTIAGTITSDDHAVDALAGKIIYSGAATPQILDGDDYVNNTLDQVTVNKDVDANLLVKNQVNITTNFKITQGDITVDDGANIAFKSNATKTAIFGKVADCQNTTITYNGSGSVTAERYIPAGTNNRRAYRLLSPPINSDGTIQDNWQEGAHNSVRDYNQNQDPNPGFGTHITGSKTDQNGFDVTQTGNPSMFQYLNDQENFAAIANTDAIQFNAGDPYFLLIRGDRSVNTTKNAPTPTNTTLRTTGKLVFCEQDVSNQLSTNANDLNFVGNPYQCSVDMQKLLQDPSTSGLVNDSYYVYDPNLNTRGGYVLVNVNDGSSVPNASGANQYVQPGQALFVINDNSTGARSLTFTEDDKYEGPTNLSVFKVGEKSSQSAFIGLTLKTLPKNSSNMVTADGIKVNFANDGAERALPKFSNLDENLAIAQHGKSYVIHSFSKETQTIALSLTQYRNKKYQFVIDPHELGELQVDLIDTYTGKTTKITGKTTYAFQVDGQADSKAADRFQIAVDATTLGNKTIDDIAQVEAYPNPFTTAITVKFKNGNGPAHVSLYSITGKTIISKQVKASQREVKLQNIGTLSQGIYLLKITQDGHTKTQKLIKQ